MTALLVATPSIPIGESCNALPRWLTLRSPVPGPSGSRYTVTMSAERIDHCLIKPLISPLPAGIRQWYRCSKPRTPDAQERRQGPIGARIRNSQRRERLRAPCSYPTNTLNGVGTANHWSYGSRGVVGQLARTRTAAWKHAIDSRKSLPCLEVQTPDFEKNGVDRRVGGVNIHHTGTK